MQIDMHYYGTYCLARAAGLAAPTAEAIARASQYVDDNAATSDAIFSEKGVRFHGEATAHHPLDHSNLDEDDQRKVWVPFHFLPAADGNGYLEKLVCGMDSGTARAAVDHALLRSDRPYAAEIMGIMAHVYADTFSHYGFSGVSSHLNRVVDNSIQLHGVGDGMRAYVLDKHRKFAGKYSAGRLFDAVIAFAADNLGALGHGAVSTMPDRPYLTWSFVYEYDAGTGKAATATVMRNNQATFNAAAQALHGMFRRFAEKRPDLTDGSGRDYSAIAQAVADIIGVEAPREGRVKAWTDAAARGAFGVAEAVPPYDPDAMAVRSGDGWQKALSGAGMRFFQAAAQHRVFVLRDLMPGAGVLVT